MINTSKLALIAMLAAVIGRDDWWFGNGETSLVKSSSRVNRADRRCRSHEPWMSPGDAMPSTSEFSLRRDHFLASLEFGQYRRTCT
jgi:hypothetical protein